MTHSQVPLVADNSKKSRDIFCPDLLHLALADQIGAPLEDRYPLLRAKFSEIPDVAGVYYFLGENAEPLYIGKSVHIRQRLHSHLLAAKDDERAAKYMFQAHSLGWRETAGDLHAQLLENREIKAISPLFNRAQRRLKRFFTWQFSVKNPLHLEVKAVQGKEVQEGDRVCYGLYKSAAVAKQAMKSLADREELCLAVLGIERASGACFRSQIGKCAGACAGRESIDEMVERLLESLLPWSFQLWPYPGPIQTEEGGKWHVLYRWQSLGVFETKLTGTELKKLARQVPLAFDKDEYRIIRRCVSQL